MPVSLEQRVAALEQQLAKLQGQQPSIPTGREWLGDLYGKFANDKIFQQAMKLGQKYRKSLRPQIRRAKSRR